MELEEAEQEEEDEEDRLYMEMALEEEQRNKAASTPRAKPAQPVVTPRPTVAELLPLPENSSGCARSEPYRKIPDVEKVQP